jgi:hypothetical protein
MVNAFAVFLLHVLAWIATLFVKDMDPVLQIPGTWRYRIRDAFYITVPIQVLIFTTSESSLLLFYQWQNMIFDNPLDTFSFIFAMIYLVYFLAFIFYVARGLNKDLAKMKSNDIRKFNFFITYLNPTRAA